MKITTGSRGTTKFTIGDKIYYRQSENLSNDVIILDSFVTYCNHCNSAHFIRVESKNNEILFYDLRDEMRLGGSYESRLEGTTGNQSKKNGYC